MKKLIQKLLVIIPVVLIVVIIAFLFKNDLEIMIYQFAISAKIISQDTTKVSIFADKSAEQKITQGYVEYVEPGASPEPVQYHSLSSVHARLSISRVGIDGPIVEGNDEDAMKYGFWHIPSASPFDTKGNVTIIGHRYLKLPPNKDTFYNLDKVRIGDEIVIDSVYGKIIYRAKAVWVINSSETSVLEKTENAQLTLITCHPLWTSRQRLVIIADQVDRKLKN